VSDNNSSLSVVTSGAVIFFIGNAFSNAAKFILQLLITRSLGAGSFGVYSYGLTILSVVGTFARLGVTESIMRFVPEFDSNKRKQGRYVTIAFCTTIIGSLIAAAALFMMASTINSYTLDNPLFENVLQIFAILLPLQTLTQAVSNTFRAFEDAKYQIFIRDVLVPFLNITTVAVAIISGATIVGVSAAIAVAGFLSVCIGFILLFQKININVNIDTNKTELYGYYNFSIPLTLTAAGSLLYTNVDRLMVGYFLGDVEVGIYAISIGLATATGLVLSGLNQLFPPIASKLYSSNNRAELSTVFSTVTRWSFSLSLLPAILLFTYRIEVLSIFGPEFVAGSTVLSLFILAQVTRNAVGPSGYMLMMTGHQYVVLFNRWFLGVSNVIANYILILRMGFIGAAIASALTLALVNLLRLVEIWVLERYNPYTKRYYKPVIAGLITFIFVELARNQLIQYDVHVVLLLAIGISSGTFCYLSLLYLLGIDDVDKEIYAEFTNK